MQYLGFNPTYRLDTPKNVSTAYTFFPEIKHSKVNCIFDISNSCLDQIFQSKHASILFFLENFVVLTFQVYPDAFYHIWF